MEPSPACPIENPATLQARLQKAIALHQQGQLQQARLHYRAILALDMANLDALYLSALLELASGALETALDLIQGAVAIAPQHAQIHFTHANVLQGLQRLPAALASYDAALRFDPQHVEAHYNRGLTLQAMQRHAEALSSYDAALALKPLDADACLNRGVALQELQRFDEALASLGQALRLAPGDARVLYNRGLIWQKRHHPQRALADFDAALAIDTRYVEAWINRGAALEQLARHDEALAAYEQALAIRPDAAKAHWNEALVRLSAGDFARGWPKHEWRWEALALQTRQAELRRPLWLGQESLQGRTILLHAEQGLGDTLQFCRYAKLVAALGATVVLQVQAPLKSLLSTLEGVHLLAAEGEPLPAFDFHCPLLSLPLALQTNFDTLPSASAYLAPAAALCAQWQRRLGPRHGMRVGIAWSGNPGHGNDHNRSLPLAQMLALCASVPQVQFISMQKEIRAGDRDLLAAQPQISHFGAHLHDFGDTAALLANLDLIISVDTSVAHLAGALGKPLWIILPFSADWRWLRQRSDSPWYPSARLWRQERLADWSGVMQKIAGALVRAAQNDKPATE